MAQIPLSPLYFDLSFFFSSLSFLSLSFHHTAFSVGGTQPCHLTATGMRETHLLPEPAADLELTFCDEDLWLILGLFALIPPCPAATAITSNCGEHG